MSRSLRSYGNDTPEQRSAIARRLKQTVKGLGYWAAHDATVLKHKRKKEEVE